jgi:hypothetical protein
MSDDPEVIEAEISRRWPTAGPREASKVAARDKALSWARINRTGLGRWGRCGESENTAELLQFGD